VGTTLSTSVIIIHFNTIAIMTAEERSDNIEENELVSVLDTAKISSV
jgi:hypothetical protein